MKSKQVPLMYLLLYAVLFIVGTFILKKDLNFLDLVITIIFFVFVWLEYAKKRADELRNKFGEGRSTQRAEMRMFKVYDIYIWIIIITLILYVISFFV